MALLQAILTALTRSLGRILNTVFGWATSLLFGRVSQDCQIYLSVIAFGAVLWLALVVGIAFPSVGTFLIGFVPLSDSVDENYARLAMFLGALIVPALIGVISLRMIPEHERKASSWIRTVGMGYPYTIGLAVALVFLTVVAPFKKIRELFKRWQAAHVPVVIAAADYETVIGQIGSILDSAGIQNERQVASWFTRFPTTLLTTLASSVQDQLVARNLAVLKLKDGEILIHPSDIIINTRKNELGWLQALLAEKLVFSPAHMTWTKEAQNAEDQLLETWQSLKNGRSSTSEVLARLEIIDQSVRSGPINFEEWEVLYRERATIERALLQSKGNQSV